MLITGSRCCRETQREGLERKQRAMTVAAEKGASSWLSTMPIAGHGLTLQKETFRDALCLHYMNGLHISNNHSVSVVKGSQSSMH